MSETEWAFILRLARDEAVTLKDAGVTRRMTLGQAIDYILAAAGK